jgi:hypothetical protein
MAFASGAAVAAAAAAALVLSLRHAESPAQIVAVTATPAPVSAAPSSAAAQGSGSAGSAGSGVAVAAAAAATASGAPPHDDAVDLSHLPKAGPGGSPAHNVAATNAANAPRATPPAVAAAPASPAAPAPESSPAPAGTDGKSLETLMQQAAGVSTASPPPQPASAPGDSPDYAPGSVPLRPSQGAVNGALGTAMPGARACLDADAPLSHATVTFKSDGSVASVSVTGWAAGKPVESCIRTALMKARVPPFAQPTYTVPATIRSN